jgi:hypothetical protein
MKEKILYKYLVIGVIVLFIGVGIQPAFAKNVSIRKISDKEDDCSLCAKKFNRLQLVLNIIYLNRLENYKNQVLEKESFCDKLERIINFFIPIMVSLESIGILLSDLGFKIIQYIFYGLSVIPAILCTPFSLLYFIFCWQPPY